VFALIDTFLACEFFDFLISFEVLIEKTGIDQDLEGLKETQQKNEYFF
jgi:hypothetical protein